MSVLMLNGSVKITVIIPTYKPKAYLWQCLTSIQNQTLDKSLFEVVIVLNGCKEPYESRICNFLESVDFSFSLVQIDEGGVSNARNKGIEVSTGEYIAFIDDDDYVSQKYLEELLIKASEDTVSLCLPIAFKDGTNECRRYALTDEYYKKSINGKQPFYYPKKLFAGPCMKLIHRSIIGDRRFDVTLHNSEDSLYMFTISDRIRWADFTSSDAVYYRRFRIGSAVTRKRSFGVKFRNALRVVWKETCVFFIYFPRYNFVFYVTRLLGAVHGLIK